MKLKSLLKESQQLDYRRMNVGEEKEKGMTNEEKRAFLEAVASYRQLGEMISHKGNLAEIHENIKKIVENAGSLTIKETGDWFDKVTVQRHMKSMNESFKVFSNTIKEVGMLQQRYSYISFTCSNSKYLSSVIPFRRSCHVGNHSF